jgi:hypothetical protein
VELGSAGITSGTGEADTVLLGSDLYGICALSLRLGETEVVVGTHVEGFGGSARHLETQVEVVRLAVEQSDESTGHSSNGASEAVVDAQLQSADVEVIEIAVQRGVSVSCRQVLVLLLLEALSEEVAHMAEDDEDEVAEVGGQEEVVGGCVLDGFGEGLSIVTTRVAVLLGAKGAEGGVCLCNAAGLFG